MTDKENERLWNSYYIEGTNVLKNNVFNDDEVSYDSYDKLKRAEVDESASKLINLSQSPLDMRIDKDRLNYIHWYIFKEIYPFAGEYRKVNMRKVGGTGTFLEIDGVEDIDNALNKLFKEISEMLKRCRTKEDFCDVLAKLYASLIFIHPYREGNGRTVREFLREFSIVYSEKLGIGYMELDWSLINKEELNEFVDVAHMFPDYISSIFMNALVLSDGKKR